jgi:hypothetical protein
MIGIIEYQGECITVMNTWDIFSKNSEAIQQDFDYLTADRFRNLFLSKYYSA